MRFKCGVLILIALLFMTFGTAFYPQLKSFGVKAIPVPGVVGPAAMGVYWDENCVIRITHVDWGGITLGSSKSIVVFVENEGNASLSLWLESSNWDPPRAADFISLTWNYTGETLASSQAVPLRLSLSVSSGIEAVNVFIFDIVISGKEIGSLVYSITIASTGFVGVPYDMNIDGKVDMEDIAIASSALGSFLGNSRYNPDADVNVDNKIDMLDIALIARNFGKTL